MGGRGILDTGNEGVSSYPGPGVGVVLGNGLDLWWAGVQAQGLVWSLEGGLRLGCGWGVLDLWMRCHPG